MHICWLPALVSCCRWVSTAEVYDLVCTAYKTTSYEKLKCSSARPGVQGLAITPELCFMSYCNIPWAAATLRKPWQVCVQKVAEFMCRVSRTCCLAMTGHLGTNAPCAHITFMDPNPGVQPYSCCHTSAMCRTATTASTGQSHPGPWTAWLMTTSCAAAPSSIAATRPICAARQRLL